MLKRLFSLFKKGGNVSQLKQERFAAYLYFSNIELFVLSFNNIEDTVEYVSQTDDKLKIHHWKENIVPVFTSIEKIFEGGFLKPPVEYTAMKGKAMFDMLKEYNLLIDPYSDKKYYFTSEEIKAYHNH